MSVENCRMQIANCKLQIAVLVYSAGDIIGKLVIVNRKARKGRNPATGATIDIPAKRVLKFRIAKAAKDATGKK